MVVAESPAEAVSNIYYCHSIAGSGLMVEHWATITAYQTASGSIYSWTPPSCSHSTSYYHVVQNDVYWWDSSGNPHWITENYSYFPIAPYATLSTGFSLPQHGKNYSNNVTAGVSADNHGFFEELLGSPLQYYG
jgi:hypothetical protein